VGAALVLANDPDADRLAAAERQLDGSYRAFSGNEIGLLLAHWVWERWRQAHPEVGQGGGGATGRLPLPRACRDCLIVLRLSHCLIVRGCAIIALRLLQATAPPPRADSLPAAAVPSLCAGPCRLMRDAQHRRQQPGAGGAGGG
jgi:hypothetical protein